MWDALVVIVLCNSNFWMHFEYIAFSGFPLTFLLFYVFWSCKLFPESMYVTTFEINLLQVILMLLLIDIFQTVCHYLAHTHLRHTLLGRSHAIHHTNRNPKPQDAFFTGIVDSVAQVIIPICLVLHIVEPSKYSAILFGSLYSWWLLFLHSDPCHEYKILEYLHIVTPKYHHKHHTNPTTNFSNLLRL